ncbi:MAG: RNA polymerase Rpb6 [Bacteroidales bacterium]|jgi:DNA-directed RNA polymerase subunit K/omega|nr:DNA-directed RNA polymerase subunit omega [Bacteroidales bacterium]HOL98957.1 DNA-directed RNA polymerase subunit omega [Bacteroidales bacterium]HOM36868.1 DNA-directed RNA polymerase subunit omega [Bacteroidales bacterium]HPD24189.1 DNA-directed RNA polymerase subunit omega [Bacteroidales bacterium]HRS99873.1 DNA-directed RNA polymerase subunit omega [Bacteroidales bacterium]
MDYKKTEAPVTTVTRNIVALGEKTGNIYEVVMICAKMADKINQELREELYKKLEEFSSYTDNLEEIHENREQIDVSKYYEKLSKPTLIAVEEFINDRIYYKTVEDEEQERLDSFDTD